MSSQTSSLAEADAELRLYPRLTRFYGVGFKELSRMPRWAVALYASAIPGLVAEEQLRAFEVSILPHLAEAKDRERAHDRWARLLDHAPEEPAQRPLDARALAAIGIRLVVEGGESNA